ncbi:MAG: glycosyltransferase family 39 protein [Xanthobacteraceae bacterium]
MSQASDSAVVSTPASRSAGRWGLLAWIERRPASAFGVFLTVHFAVWTALPTLLYANLPLDLIEALTYGREWVLGSDKLPPLPWWLVEIMYRLFGADVAYYALAEIVVIIAFALVWATARQLVGPTRALIAVLIIDGLHYYGYTAAKFNHDVIQLPFWALSGYAFHSALKRGKLRDWLLLGFAFGGALWAKYFVVVLAAPYALFLIFDRDARRVWRTPGPWIGIAFALIIVSPHLVWLIENHFVPFNYVDARSAAARGWFSHLWHPAFFAVGQLYFLLPTLLIAAMYLWPRHVTPKTVLAVIKSDWKQRPRVPTQVAPPDPTQAATLPETGPQSRADDFDRRIVTVIALGPAAAMLALIGASGRGTITMWGYPLWLFLGLWIVLFAPRALESWRLRRIVGAWSAVFVALMLAFIADYTVLPLIDHRYRAEFFPGARLAHILTQRFHAATGGKPLHYVIGSMWLGGNLAHYSPDQPHVLIDGLPRRAPWVDLNELRAKGAILVWDVGDLERLPAPFAALAPNAKVGPSFTLPARRFGSTLEHIGWAILMPK